MNAAPAAPRSGSASGNGPRGVYGAVPRLISLALALGMSGVIFADPRSFAHAGHGLLSLVMLGVCAGFVHGVGFVPYARVWRVLFSPWLAWSLMGTGLWLLASL